MSLGLKPEPRGARIRGLRPEVVLAAMIADGVWRELGIALCVITSGIDGQHSTQSLHHSGSAIDLRTRDMTVEQQQKAKALLNARLGVDFDVVVEPDHIHIEYQPRGAS